MTLMNSILLVDDDEAFCQVMERALTRRGYDVSHFQSASDAISAAKDTSYSNAVVDLKIAHESGLNLIKELKLINANMAIIMLTGYSSIPTAVEAIKYGALNYFCKPIEVDEILRAFAGTGAQIAAPIPEVRPSLERIEWELIQKTLQENEGNISLTARTLGMHRRTLQRKLQKKPVSS